MELKLKWSENGIAECGPFTMKIRRWLHSGKRWDWQFRWGVSALTDSPGFSLSEEAAKAAAEKWLTTQVKRMQKDLSKGGK